MSAIRRILWQRLNSSMLASVGPDWMSKRILLYGAGGLGQSFMQTFPQLKIEAFLDSDAARFGTEFSGLPIRDPASLRGADCEEFLVFITSSWHEEIRMTLETLGLRLNQEFFYGNQQAHGRIFFYLRDMSDFENAFDWMDERSVDYTILRWFESLPHKTPDDIDLLVRTSHLERLFDNPYFESDPGGVPVEVYWSEPLGQEDELLYYPTWLAERLLHGRERKACGAFGPSPETYLASLAYHAVFHKAERAKLPLRFLSGPELGSTASEEISEDDLPLPNKYADAIRALAKDQGIDVDLSLDGLWNFLSDIGWHPPVDLARRYALSLQSPWLMEKVGPLADAEENVLVFVMREWLCEQPTIMDAVLAELESLGLRRIEILTLSAEERARAAQSIRGGNWIESEASRVGGPPGAFAVFFDPQPRPPEANDRLLRPFCTNQKLAEKTELKQRIARLWNDGKVVNFLHAADDEREALEYLECLEPDRLRMLLSAIDRAERAEP